MWIIDSTIDAVQDFMVTVSQAYFAPEVMFASGEAKAANAEKIFAADGPLHKFLVVMENRLQSKNFIGSGNTITIADFSLGAFLFATVYNEDSPNYLQFQSVVKDFPNIGRFADKFKTACKIDERQHKAFF